MNSPESRQGMDENGYIRFKPIGTVRNGSKDASWGNKLQLLDWQERAARMKSQTETVSELVINTDLEDSLDRLEEYSHLLVIYWPHLAPLDKRSALKVHPLGSSAFPLVGVMATRSPIRPNSILVTKTRLIERKGNVLKVTGLDALDGSPILDLKPCMPESTDGEKEVVPEWMQRVNDRFVPGEQQP